ncbi:MAG TPA: MgtC/SapB family protein [Longimicrobiales bacterium]|nr:MgtC/SapB family protein [Longimicrobiales bacterium]
MLGSTFMDLLIALGIGLLVGLQKERTESPLAGLRTFALASLLGAVAALLSQQMGSWIIVAGLLVIAALMVTGNVMLMRRGDIDPGQTTEVAIVLTFLVGALVVVGPREVAIVLGATMAMLLHLRDELKGWVKRLSDRDVRAVMQFVVISLIILPVLPDQTYGPYDVLNPRQIWWMVVLIVGMNLAGYAAFRLMGQRAGTALAGVLGGTISSTATTMSYARLAKASPSHTKAAVVIVWIASGIVFVRILIEIGAVAPAFLPTAAGPVSVMIIIFVVAAVAIWKSSTAPTESPLDPGNPSELKPALLFGALYAAVLLVVAAAQDMLGNVGLFAAAALSGLTDIDAITLSTSRLVATGVVDQATGWRLILVGAMSNMLFKFGLAASLGTQEMAKRLAVLFSLAIAVGAGLIVVWP